MNPVLGKSFSVAPIILRYNRVDWPFCDHANTFSPVCGIYWLNSETIELIVTAV